MCLSVLWGLRVNSNSHLVTTSSSEKAAVEAPAIEAPSRSEGGIIMADDYRSFLEQMISEAEEGDLAGRISRATKTRQLNMKVTEELYARVRVLASKLGVSMPVLVERAIDALEETLTGTR
jgi:hypothetical protein